MQTELGVKDRRVQSRRAEDYFWISRLGDVTGDGCMVVNAQLRVEFSDVRASDLLEVPSVSIAAGADFAQLAHHMSEIGYFGPGDPRAFQALLTDMLVNQRLKQTRATQTLRATTPKGRHIELKIMHGRDDRFIVVIRDLTKSFFEEQALATALKVGDSGYWVYNLDTKSFFVSGGHILEGERFGFKESLNLEGFSAIIHENERDDAASAFFQCIETRQPRHTTCRLVDTSGNATWVKAHMQPHVDESRNVRSVICFFHDMTEQLRTQDKLRTAQQQAETMLEAKSSFLGRFSHEIRTPLNAVIGMADAIIHNGTDAALKTKLTLIQDSAETIVRMVDDTLQLTKLEEAAIELDPRDASVADLAHRVAALWAGQAAKSDTQVGVLVDPSVPEAMVLDDFRLEQCLNNLVSNAVKFTENGRVDIILNTAGTGAAQQLVIAVRDTGIGMSDEQAETIFQPYRQANKSIPGRFGGTGLGLAITKDLIELMGGRITVRSEEGEGTVFVLTHPVVLPEQHALGSDELVAQILPSAQKSDDDYAGLRVLIVDDNETNHLVVGSLLENIVSDIVTAMDGEEAIALLHDSGPFDVVLMDIHMPVMDGIEATLAIRSSKSAYADVPIIALTADPQYQHARLCRNIGMDDALSKPVRLSGLLASFDRVLDIRADNPETLAA